MDGFIWSLVFLLTGVGGAQVSYPPPVRAVRGSSVLLPCSFTPVQKQNGRPVEVVRVVWCRNHEICHLTTPSVYDSSSAGPRYPGNRRYRYLGDLTGVCSLQINDLQIRDSGVLRFRMEARTTEGHFTGKQGVQITVVEGTRMVVKSSGGDGQVRSGDNLTLSCTSDYTFHQLGVTWFRDGHALSESGPALRLRPLTAEDSGNYTCCLSSNKSSMSAPYSLQVENQETASAGLFLLIGGGFFGVLAVFGAVIAILFIRRRRAADRECGAVEVDQKVSPPVEDISYASVHFKHSRGMQQEEEEVGEAVIYSSIANRG